MLSELALNLYFINNFANFLSEDIYKNIHNFFKESGAERKNLSE
jgi:hypothetical protein